MKKVSKANIYFLCIMLGAIFVPYLLRPIIRATGITDILGIQLFAHTTLYLTPVIIYFLITKQNVKEVLRFNKISLKNLFWVILIGFLSIPLSYCCSVIGLLFFQNNIGTFMTAATFTSPFWFLTLVLAISPAIVEEINMRGIVLFGYNGKSAIKAAIFSGLLFGIFHLDGHQFVGAAVLGFVMAYVVRVTDSIFSSMIIHFMVNMTSVISLQSVKNMETLDKYKETITENGRPTMSNLPFASKIAIFQIALVIGIIVLGIIMKIINTMKMEVGMKKLVNDAHSNYCPNNNLNMFGNYQNNSMNGYGNYQNNPNGYYQNNNMNGYGNYQNNPNGYYQNNNMNGYGNYQNNPNGYYQNNNMNGYKPNNYNGMNFSGFNIKDKINEKFKEDDGEKLINIPFLLIVIVYLVEMFIKL